VCVCVCVCVRNRIKDEGKYYGWKGFLFFAIATI